MEQNPNWWKQAVIYQIYPRSFQDSDGDGYGDIPGIISRLDYLEKLGIDAIWLSPVCRSPQYDNGYDVSDYQDIDPMFGNLADMDRLIEEAGKRGIRIILDLVLNHTSHEHPWFLEAKKSRDNPYHDYYIWRDAEPGERTDVQIADFGDGSWQWVPEVEQFYYYQFSVWQPDLNWSNPKVRHALYDMINWWSDRGVGGFRLDVVDHLGKEPFQHIKVDGPKLHDYIKEMSAAAFQRPGLVTVGEAWSSNPESAKLYSNPDGSELSMVFQFEHILLDKQTGGDKWDLAPLPLKKFKQVMCRWQQSLHGCGWNSLFYENHDLPRIVSRWGHEGRYRVESAKMLAILLFGMEGTPYIYQGQELGMTNVHLGLEEYDDIETRNMIAARRAAGYSDDSILTSAYGRSRDNARTPMQWSAAENAGFTTGKPWLKVNENYPAINAENQVDDPDSIFACYQKLIRLRREVPVITDGVFELLLPEDEDIFAYTRTKGDHKLLVVCNFRDREIENPLKDRLAGMTRLIGNYGDVSDTLRPYEAVMYHL